MFKQQNGDQASGTRSIIVITLVSLGFLILAGRLWYLQIFKGETFRSMSENNRIRLRYVPAARGIIYDRDGEILAGTRPSFDVSVIPEDVRDIDEVLDWAARELGLSGEEIEKKRARIRRGLPFRPVTLKEDITWETLCRLEAKKSKLPGIHLEVDPRRSYPFDGLFAHLIGYTGEIGQEQLREREDFQYLPGDRVGRFGIEKRWERELRGVRGGGQVEVDASGRELRVLHEVKPKQGSTVRLNISTRLQRAARDALGDRAGAVAAMDPGTGEVLVLCSAPDFDSNLFSSEIDASTWKGLIDDPKRPLVNKVLHGQYPPGSVFKVIPAFAALEEEAVEIENPFPCTGSYRLGRRSYNCWKVWGHGEVALHRAIVESCDIYYFNLARELGIDGIAAYARRCGLGRRTGVGLEGEMKGLVPDSAWKERTIGEKWYEGESLSVIIGQGYVLTTPMQILTLYAAIANDGVIMRPLIVNRVESTAGVVLSAVEPEETGRFDLSPRTLDIVQAALIGAVEDEGGTGRAAHIDRVKVAGKTGTAQVVSYKGDSRDLPYHMRTHAWFACYAPADDPEIAVVVLVEHGGHGGSAAAPVAGKVLDAYFKGRMTVGVEGNVSGEGTLTGVDL